MLNFPIVVPVVKDLSFGAHSTERMQLKAPMSILLLVLLLCCVELHAAVDKDEVTDLPGLSSKPTFRQYSGYLNATGTRKLHYWFTESSNSPSGDPVVLWMNGGPGCSSLDGFLSEHGPFQINDDGATLTNNPFSWNKVANMLYLEAPAGVGFSYADDRNYTTDDDQTSLDNYWALKTFFKLYPEFSANEFYITGESYGGIYVPTLSVRVAVDKDINFKGFAVGNGISDYTINSNSQVYYAYYHSLVDQKMWLNAVAACCKNANSTLGNCNFVSDDPSCQAAAGPIFAAVDLLNIYNIYAECYQPNLSKEELERTYFLPPPPRRFSPDVWTSHKVSNVNGSVRVSVPCVNATAITTYLNTPAVKKALHIADGLPDWTICSDLDYGRVYSNVQSQYMAILSTKKQRILVYNGDFDMACNYLGDEWFVDSLNLTVKKPWLPWHSPGSYGSKQVAGFAKQFENLVFATVKGAGHMVPSDKPQQALVMFQNFLKDSF